MTMTFKCEHRDWTTKKLNSTVTLKLDLDLNINEVFQEFGKFLLAAGYQPESIRQYIEQE